MQTLHVERGEPPDVGLEGYPALSSVQQNGDNARIEDILLGEDGQMVVVENWLPQGAKRTGGSRNSGGDVNRTPARRIDDRPKVAKLRYALDLVRTNTNRDEVRIRNVSADHHELGVPHHEVSEIPTNCVFGGSHKSSTLKKGMKGRILYWK